MSQDGGDQANSLQRFRRRSRWYASRLAAMTPAEVAHRVREQALMRLPIGGGPMPAVRVQVAPATQALGDFVDRTICACAGLPDSARSRVDELLDQNTVTIFGESFDVAQPHWNLDPLSRHEWPLLPSHRIDYRHSGGADPKYSWEFNRLLYFLPIAVAARHGYRQEEVGNALRRLTATWAGAQKAGSGIAWASGIEVALRVIALIASEQLLDGGGSLAPEAIALLPAHILWLKRFPSRYSSANNHRVAEIVALLLAGSQTNLEVDGGVQLEEELAELTERLFFQDGVAAEQSPTYGAFTLELLALAAHCHRWTDSTSLKRLSIRIARAADALLAFQQPDGTLYRFGDDDEGRVYTWGAPTQDYAAAVVRGIADLRPHSERGACTSTFALGGYSVVRRQAAGSTVMWVLDHGELGYGALAAHGHADVLSVGLWYAGVQWFPDAGTFRYHGSGHWRNYFRSEDVHNGPRIAGSQHSVMTGAFNWSRDRRANGHLVSARDEAVEFEVAGAYTSVIDGREHRVTRRLQGVSQGCYRIVDESDAACCLVVSFVLDPECSVEQLPHGWRLRHPRASGAVRVSVAPDALQTKIKTRLADAWYSPEFGRKDATTQLIFETEDGNCDQRRASLMLEVYLEESDHPKLNVAAGQE